MLDVDITIRQKETLSSARQIQVVSSSEPFALGACITELYGPLYDFALALSRSHAEAADLTQQTFFELIKHQTQIRDLSKIRFWLFTTLRRQFLGRLRSVYCEVELRPEHEQALAIESVALRSIDASVVRQALARIDARYRTTLELFYLQDLSYKEIGELLKVPIGTVMSRLARGKEQVRRLLSPTSRMAK